MLFKRTKPIFKLACVLQINKRYIQQQRTSDLLADYFGKHFYFNRTMLNLQIYVGITERKANFIVKKCKIKPDKRDNLMQVLKFLHEVGVTKEEIMLCPTVMGLHPITLEQRYLLYQETGFLNIKPAILTK